MSAEWISLLISIAGLVLGFVAAYGQIKAFGMRIFRSSGEAAKRSFKKQDDLASFYLDNPSVFVAYIAKSFVLLFITFFGGLILRPALALGVVSVPQWIANTLDFVAPAIAGLIVGSITSNCSAVKHIAQKRLRASRSAG